ncbi:MAG: trypsin-like serine protease [Bdellovibrionales bacterium]|nr:trypsin-like serine protease [Bdellovibrionales bacterium]
MRVLNFFTIVILSFCLACGGSGVSENEQLATERRGCGDLGAQRVFNGETCSQEFRSPVVAVLTAAFAGEQLIDAAICTGALVTIDDFVTSAHCFTDLVIKYPGANFEAAIIVGGANGEVLGLSNLAIHPFYDYSGGSPFDIAMATLTTVPNPPIGPIPFALSQATLPGDLVTAFGYGTNNRGEIGELKAADITIEAIEGGNMFGFLSTSGVALCGGDSGGPVVKQLNGITALVGVNSFNVFGSNCDTSGAPISGMIDIQFPTILDFMIGYAPDIPVA